MHHVILSVAKNLRCFLVILSKAKNLRCIMSFWASAKDPGQTNKLFWILRRFAPLNDIFTANSKSKKFCYIYNIMSYPTFWHQKNQKNPTPQLWYLSIFLKKFTTIVNFTKTVKNWHLFSKIHYFTESVKKFAF